MESVTKALSDRLTMRGVARQVIPTYVRDVARICAGAEGPNQTEVNHRMRVLGWDEFDLDDLTLQQIVATVETLGLDSLRGHLLRGE